MKINQNQSGFTILETVISLTIFSSLLILSTFGFTRIGTIYSKSITISKNLELTRGLVSDIASQIQFGSSLPDLSVIGGSQNLGDTRIFCVGDYAYEIKFGVVQTPDIIPVIRRQKILNKTCPSDLDLSSAENLSYNKIRVQKFQINKVASASDLWIIKIKISTGDDNLFNQTPAISLNPAGYESWICRGDINGSEFCAVTELETIVKRKVNI